MKNTGIPYELLVQSIFQEIVKEKVATVTVQHDVSIKGKSGVDHQIDVFWEFELGAANHKTVIQAKDWATNPISQAIVFAFHGVLNDIPGQPRGIMVTSNKYQPGAQEYAKHHGIELFELKEQPKPEPFVVPAYSFGTFFANVKERSFEVTPFPVKYTIHKMTLNAKWANQHLTEEEQKAIVNSTIPDVRLIKLTDEYSNEIATFGKTMQLETAPFEKEAQKTLEKEAVYQKNLQIKFDKPTFFLPDSDAETPLQIDALDFSVEITKGELQKRPFQQTGVSTFILKHILEGSERKFKLTQKVSKEDSSIS